MSTSRLGSKKSIALTDMYCSVIPLRRSWKGEYLKAWFEDVDNERCLTRLVLLFSVFSLLSSIFSPAEGRLVEPPAKSRSLRLLERKREEEEEQETSDLALVTSTK